MTGYNNNIPERQSLSAVKMGRGSSPCESLHGEIMHDLRIMCLNIKFQRTWGFHHQCYTKSWKHSENPEKFLYARGEAKNFYWTVFYHFYGILKHTCICFWAYQTCMLWKISFPIFSMILFHIIPLESFNLFCESYCMSFTVRYFIHTTVSLCSTMSILSHIEQIRRLLPRISVWRHCTLYNLI